MQPKWLIQISLILVCASITSSSTFAQKTKKTDNLEWADRMFDRYARGKPYLDVSTWQRGREDAENFLKKKGVRDNKMTKALFREYMGQKKAKQEREASKKMTKADVRKKAEEYFKKHDRNKDGRLNRDEMTSRLRGQLDKWDRNRDRLITFSEYVPYIEGFYQSRMKGGNSGADESVTIILLEDLDIRPNVFSGTNLPTKGLPEWFGDYDVNKDGQVSIYEWRKMDEEPLTNFPVWDHNNDGLITLEEAIRQQIVEDAKEVEEEK